MDFTGSSNESSSGFNDYWLILRRRWMPAAGVFVIVFALALLAVSRKKPTYVAEGTLKFERTSPTSSLTGLGKEISNLEPLVEKSSPLATESEVIRSTPVIQEAMERLNLKDDKGQPLKRESFLKNLKVGEIRGTDILKVSYTDANPKQAAAVVNALIEIYIENNILSHRAQAVAAREFIEEQLPKAEAAVSQAEEMLRQFKETNRVVALKEEATAAVSIMTELYRQVADTQAQIADVSAEARVFQNKLGIDSQQAVSIANLSQTSGVQEALKELQLAEAQLMVDRSRLQEEHPKIIRQKAKVESLNQLVQQRIAKVLGDRTAAPSGNLQMGDLQQDLTKELVMLEGKRQGLTEKLAALAQTQITYGKWAHSLPKLEKEQRELERRLEAAQTTYSQLLQKNGEIRVAENQNVGNARTIAAAQIPEKPASSNKITYLAALLLGILASAATVYIVEIRDKSIKTVERSRKLFGFTLLGVVPYHNKTKKTITERVELDFWAEDGLLKEPPTSSIGAAYRILHANLKFLSSDKPFKVIVISSSVPQEGKSTVSANLAATMAQQGRRVLLVDADMHSPIQHRVWDLFNEVGLSNMLVEQAEPGKAIKAVTTNLDVLTSGVVPPNSIALLDSQRMATLIETFSANYDYVIIDTPPLTRATDALILGKMADGILLVVRPEWLDVGSATFAKGLLAQSNQNVLGQVVNGVVIKNEPHSHYYFASDRYPQGNMATLDVPEVVTRFPSKAL